MSNFHHPNILTLKGVCLDGGPAPYIIMPFMANGSLLAYQRKNRNSLVISCENVDVSLKLNFEDLVSLFSCTRWRVFTNN